MFDEIKKELQGKSARAIYLYLKRIDLSSVIQYLKENSNYNDFSEKRRFKLVQDFLKGRNNICPVCGKIIEHGSKNCSLKCAALNSETQKRREQTCLGIFGVKHPAQNLEIQEKSKESNIKKFGVPFAAQNLEIQEKSKESNIKKFGVPYASQNLEIKEKTRETNNKKFGVDNPFQNEEIKKKIRDKCLDHFGVTNYSKSDEFKQRAPEFLEKRKKKCLEHFGVEFPAQSDIIKERTVANNLKIYGTEWPIQNKDVQWKIKSNNIMKYGVEYPGQRKIKNYELYNNKNYIKENLFLDDCTPNSKAIQEFFGIDQPNCSNHLRKLFGDEIHYNTGSSNAERELQDYVKSLTENVICNDRTIIKPKELDIVLPDAKLAIEYDGMYWHSSTYVKENYHLEKTQLCAENGYQLFHIFEFDDIEIWKSMISNKLKLNNKIYARKCQIKELKYNQIKDFLTENHLQGACTSKINLGLFYNDELVEVMTFSKPRFNRNYDYELLRLCSKKFYSVIGGATKLFKYFISNYKGSIISYANRRFSNGNIYRQLGFNKLKESKPNYFYCKDYSVLTRYQCQKHKLKDLYNKGILDEYDSELTESEIMDRNLYFKLYDCGNLVFEYKR